MFECYLMNFKFTIAAIQNIEQSQQLNNLTLGRPISSAMASAASFNSTDQPLNLEFGQSPASEQESTISPASERDSTASPSSDQSSHHSINRRNSGSAIDNRRKRLSRPEVHQQPNDSNTLPNLMKRRRGKSIKPMKIYCSLPPGRFICTINILLSVSLSGIQIIGE